MAFFLMRRSGAAMMPQPSQPDQRSTRSTGSVAGPHAVWIAPTILFLFLFLPPALVYLFNASSFAVGVMATFAIVGSVYILGLMEPRLDDGSGITLSVLVTAFIGLHLFTVYFFRPLDIPRAFQSLVLLGVAIALLPLVRNLFFDTDAEAMNRGVAVVRWTVVIVAILSVLDIQPPSDQFMTKPTFPFTEPSFLAFSFAPILVYTCVKGTHLTRLLWLAATVVAGLYLGNLTLVATALLAAGACLSIPRLAIALLLAAYVATQIDLTYFEERLEFSSTTTNLSALVYVQGWQMTEESLRNSLGWGIGFQQLGVAYTNVPASYQIFRMMGFDVNIRDGGFLTAKLVSEFGVIGLVLIGSIAVMALRFVWRLRAAAFGKAVLPTPTLLAYSSIYGSIVEIFARGANYFTGTMVLLGASLWYLHSQRRQRT